MVTGLGLAGAPMVTGLGLARVPMVTGLRVTQSAYGDWA